MLDPEPRTAVMLRRFLQVLVGLVAFVIVARGISSLVQGPPSAPPAPSLPASVTFPTSQAEGVAARWTSAYLSLSPAQSRSRAAGMALDTPAGSATENTGWNGQGAVVVRNVVPAGIQVVEPTRAVVTVLAQITNGKAPAQWLGVSVPVHTDGARVLVDGTGAAFTSLPGEGSSPMSPTEGPRCRVGDATCTPDADLTAQTKAGGAAFFAAFAARDAGALSQATAPGVNLAPLGGTVQPVGVSEWTVYQGQGPTRPATATVTWRLGAAEIQQRYRLTLTQVSASGSTSWRVAGITAG
ncbi:conjugal transfer protein [Mobilicoccus caccae]|nr:conjugal transfer protein [Mobilicoccus caccae]